MSIVICHILSVIPSYHLILSCLFAFCSTLSYHILCYSVLSYPILSYPVLSFFILFYSILSHPMLSCLISPCPVISYAILSYPALSCPVISCPVISCPVPCQLCDVYASILTHDPSPSLPKSHQLNYISSDFL